MKKPFCSRVLALSAVITICIQLLFDTFAILFPDAFPTVYWDSLGTPELPMLSTALLFAGTFSSLPFAVVCAFTAFTASISWMKSLVSLILSGVFWAGSILCSYIFNMYAVAATASANGVAVASAIIQTQEYLSHLDAIALALLCSALAIELFLQKQHSQA